MGRDLERSLEGKFEWEISLKVAYFHRPKKKCCQGKSKKNLNRCARKVDN